MDKHRSEKEIMEKNDKPEKLIKYFMDKYGISRLRAEAEAYKWMR